MKNEETCYEKLHYFPLKSSNYLILKSLLLQFFIALCEILDAILSIEEMKNKETCYEKLYYFPLKSFNYLI